MINRGSFTIADLGHLGANLVLPSGVASKEHGGPGEKESSGFMAGKEEGFAFIHDELEV